MKLYQIMLCCGLSLVSLTLTAQKQLTKEEFEGIKATAPEEMRPYQDTLLVGNMDKTVFEMNKNPRLISILRSINVNPTDIQSSRIVYRFIPVTDLINENNEATEALSVYNFKKDPINYVLTKPNSPSGFLYPVQDGLTLNLYSSGKFRSLINILIKLASNGNISTYKYVKSDIESKPNYTPNFSPEERMGFKDFMSRLILSTSTSDDNESLIKTKTEEFKEENFGNTLNGLIGFELMEQWYFDARVSDYNCMVKGIAPVFSKDYVPTCWFSYQELFPYLCMLYIENFDQSGGVPIVSYDSYFKRRLYKGLVLRTPDLDGKNLLETNSIDISNIQEAQKRWVELSDKIDLELNNFDEQYWATHIIPERVKIKEKAAAAQAQTAASSKKRNKKKIDAAPSVEAAAPAAPTPEPANN